MIGQLISQPPVWITSWVEALAVVSLGTMIAGLVGAYRHVECHRSGCHRLGRFQHGHLKLCRIHSPALQGAAVTDAHIRSVVAVPVVPAVPFERDSRSDTDDDPR
jgi:hypothetical protein